MRHRQLRPRPSAVAAALLLALAAPAGLAHNHPEDKHAGHDHDHDHAHGQEHDGQRGHGAHVHGLARLDVAAEGDTLEIALESPGMNLVGFEGAPGNAAEADRVGKAIATLADAARVFAVTPADACTAAPGKVVAPPEALVAPAAAEAGHDHDHKHDHDHGGHSDWSASWTFNCSTPPLSVEVRLFTAFTGFERIEAQVATAEFQTGVELTPASPRLSLVKAQ